MTEPGASDIARGNWIDRWMPAAVRPYLRLARLDRPIGTWLLLLPCWWGLALATRIEAIDTDGRLTVLRYAALFGLGAILMRGAGCTINDTLDRDLDARVARTAGRPIPAGQVSVRQALVFAAAQMAAAFVVLLQFNGATVLLGIASLVLVFTYPLMKRVTFWPQAFLGLAFNWGALLGWTAVRGGLDTTPLMLYAAGIAWTLGYDTIYAHQDKEDDALVGVKSTALLFGPSSRAWIAGFYAAALVLLGLAGNAAGLTWPLWLGLGAAAGHAFWLVMTVDLDDARDCLAKFRANRDFGLIVVAALLAGHLGAV